MPRMMHPGGADLDAVDETEQSEAISTAPPSDPGAGTRRRRRLRRAVVTVAVGAAVAAGTTAWNWPTDQLAERPGPVLDLGQRVRITDAAAPLTPLNGTFDGLTVNLQRLDLGGLLVHVLTRDPSTLVPVDAVEPPDVAPSVYDAYEKAAFVDGGQIAAVVAERALGYQVSVASDGLEVFAVAKGRPAAGTLEVGDVITAVDGTTISTAAALSNAVEAAHGGALSLSVTSHGTSRTVSITPVLVEGSAAPALGVIVGPANPIVTLQYPVQIDGSGVGGPSAGLMTALTVYDELSPSDVLAGRRVAGTGTIDADGNVGDIGGIQAKARAAKAAGVQLFLAPADQAADARAILGNAVPVIGVRTFAEALAALA